MAASLEHPDIHWYFPLPRPKAAGHRLVEALEAARHEELADRRETPLRPSWSDEIRAIYLGSVTDIRAKASKRPTLDQGPIFVIGQAESLVPQASSQEAANALLKLLEEPPGSARFILTSSEPGLLLPTIRSRTVPLHVGPLSSEAVEQLLVEDGAFDRERAAWAASLSQGSPGRALGFLPSDGDADAGPLEQLRRRALSLVLCAMSPDLGAAFEAALSFPASGARTLVELFSFVEEWLRDLAALASGAEASVLHRDAIERLRVAMTQSGIEASDVPATFIAVERARELARGNVNPQLVVSGLLRELRSSLSPSARKMLVP
jgi:DNA polymerase-3 subunit delta'